MPKYAYTLFVGREEKRGVVEAPYLAVAVLSTARKEVEANDPAMVNVEGNGVHAYAIADGDRYVGTLFIQEVKQ